MSFGGHIYAFLLVVYLGMEQKDSQKGKLTPQFWVHISAFPSPLGFFPLVLRCILAVW